MQGAFLTFYILATFTTTYLANAEKGLDYKVLKEEYENMMQEVVDTDDAHTCGLETVNKTDRKVDNEGCHCDKQCTVYRDCCLNYWDRFNTTFPSFAYNKPKMFKCLPKKFELMNTTKPWDLASLNWYGCEVVARCPDHYTNTTIKRACEALLLDNAPVALPFVDGEDQRTYRNKYCALCHSVVAWKHWTTKLSCSNETDAIIRPRIVAENFTFGADERKRIRETCNVLMTPVNPGTTISCNIFEECQITNSPDYRKCFAYTMALYTYSPRIPSRNPHCVRCAGTDDLAVMTPVFPGADGGSGYSPLAILFDFSKASDIYMLEKHVPKPGPDDKDTNVTNLDTNTAQSTCRRENVTFLNTSKDIIIFPNGSLYVVSHRIVYLPGQHHQHGNKLVVYACIRNQTTSTGKTSARNAKLVLSLTIVGFSFSIPALVAVLLTYFMFKELRTVPGKIIMNLSAAMLLSQVVSLISMFENVSGNSCVAMAAVLHYLYTALFCWMNAMAFDVARTFARKNHRLVGGSRRQFFFFCLLYGWGVPMIIVVIAMIVNHSGALDVGYGNQYYCWITNPIALAIFFAVPVALMLLFNIVALANILLALRRERKATRQVRHHSTLVQDAGICCKLTAVFGLTWLLGFGAGYHLALMLMHIISNSLQGVCVMIGFLMTRRVLNLYLKKAGKQPLTARTAPRGDTMSTRIRKMSRTTSTETKPSQRKATKSLDKEMIIDRMALPGVPETNV